MLKLCAVIILFLSIYLIPFSTNSSIGNIYNCSLIEKKICVVRTLNLEVLKQEKVLHDSVRLHYLTVLEFKEILGKYESNGVYNITNKYGFKGKYQFSDYLINKLTDVTPSKFLLDSILQEKTMTNIIKLYINYLCNENYIKLINKKIGNNIITLESLLLGCHFSPTYLELYINSNGNINKDDGYITIGNYMKKFERTHEEIDVLVTVCK